MSNIYKQSTGYSVIYERNKTGYVDFFIRQPSGYTNIISTDPNGETNIFLQTGRPRYERFLHDAPQSSESRT